MDTNKMKISIITTVDHNVGDDFVREGIKYLLKKHFNSKSIEFQNIHKHSPITTRYGFESLRNLRLSRIIDMIVPKNWSKDRILEADLVVQSGAPVYWCHEIGGGHCYQNEWYNSLIKKRFLKNKKAKLVNLAAGTCQKYHSDGSEFCEKCNVYMKEFYELSKVTTVRDTLSQVALSNLNISVPVIPCSSIFAMDEHGLKNEGEEYIVLNYMKGGAHYTFGQKIDFEKWEKEFEDFYKYLKEKERVVIVCHDKKEVDAVLSFDPDAEIFYEKDDYLAYMKFFSKAKYGIVNRVHAAFLMASFGKPSIIIGNDSRSRMASKIGLEHFFVNDVNFDLLVEKYKFLKSGADNFSERFNVIKKKTFEDYMSALSVL